MLEKAIEIRRSYPDRRWLVDEINSLVHLTSMDVYQYKLYCELLKMLKVGDELHLWDGALEKHSMEYFANNEIEEVEPEQQIFGSNKQNKESFTEEESIMFCESFIKSLPRYGIHIGIIKHINASKNNVVVIGNLSKEFKIRPNFLSMNRKTYKVDDQIGNIVYTSFNSLSSISKEIESSYLVVYIKDENIIFDERDSYTNTIINTYSILVEKYVYLINYCIFGKVDDELTVEDYMSKSEQYLVASNEPVEKSFSSHYVDFKTKFLLPAKNKLLDGYSDWMTVNDLGNEYAPIFDDIPLLDKFIDRIHIESLKYDASSDKNVEVLLPTVDENLIALDSDLVDHNLEIEQASMLNIGPIISTIGKIGQGVEVAYAAKKLYEKFTHNTPYMFRTISGTLITDMIVPWLYSIQEGIIENFEVRKLN